MADSVHLVRGLRNRHLDNYNENRIFGNENVVQGIVKLIHQDVQAYLSEKYASIKSHHERTPLSFRYSLEERNAEIFAEYLDCELGMNLRLIGAFGSDFYETFRKFNS